MVHNGQGYSTAFDHVTAKWDVMEKNDFEKAKVEMARAVSLDPSFSNARYFLGLILDHEGNLTEAIDQFEKISELNPDNAVVSQILGNLRSGRPALGAREIGGQVVLPFVESTGGDQLAE